MRLQWWVVICFKYLFNGIVVDFDDFSALVNIAMRIEGEKKDVVVVVENVAAIGVRVEGSLFGIDGVVIVGGGCLQSSKVVR